MAVGGDITLCARAERTATMPDATPSRDAGAVRGAIAAADFHVDIATLAIVARVAAAGEFTHHQRAAARELEQLAQERDALIGKSRALDDDTLLARGQELTSRAQGVVDRTGELRILFETTDDDPQRERPAELAEPVEASRELVDGSALDRALDALSDAALNIANELTVDAPIEIDDLLWAQQRLAIALEDIDGLYAELADRLADWRDSVLADEITLRTPAADRAFRAQLTAAPGRLRAASRALGLAARRGHLVELDAFMRPASTRIRVQGAAWEATHDGRLWLDVTLLSEASGSYSVRVAGRPAEDPTTPGVSAGELVQAIAAAAELDLADLEQRELARHVAERARRELTAIVNYRNSERRGDPQDAAGSPDPADPMISYSRRPDSSQDLVDVLLDLVAERWPVAAVLRDSLAAVCRALATTNDDDQAQHVGVVREGLERLLAHPAEDSAAGELVGALVEDYIAAALEHQARDLADPEQLRRALLTGVRELQRQQRPANLANLHAIATNALVSRERVSITLGELVDEQLLEYEDPLAPTDRAHQLTLAGGTLVDAWAGE